MFISLNVSGYQLTILLSYLRTRPAAQAIQFTVDQSVIKQANAAKAAAAAPATPIKREIKQEPITPSLATPPSSSAASGLTSTAAFATPTSNVAVAPTIAALRNLSVTNDGTASPAISNAAVNGSAQSLPISSVTTPSAAETAPTTLSSDGTPGSTSTQTPAQIDPEFAAALERQRQRELEEAKLYCSLENKEACQMCSG